MGMITIGKSNGLLKRCDMHTHGCTEIILNCSGEGEMRFSDGSTCLFAPDTVVCIPKGLGHCKISSAGFTDVYLQCTDFPFLDGTLRVFDRNEGRFIKNLLLMAFEMNVRDDKAYAAAVRCLCDGVLQLLCVMEGSNGENPAVDRFLSTVAGSFCDPEFEAAQAVRQTGYSLDHFCRLLKGKTGRTPTEILNGTRLDYAKKLLEQTDGPDYTVSEIAYLSGFYDPRYFPGCLNAGSAKRPGRIKRRAAE